jgi:hypothetical protein
VRSAVSSERLINSGTLALELLVLAVLAWQSARLIWAIATPTTPLGNWQPAPQSPVSTDRSVMVLKPCPRLQASLAATVKTLSYSVRAMTEECIAAKLY